MRQQFNKKVAKKAAARRGETSNHPLSTGSSITSLGETAIVIVVQDFEE